MKKGAIYIMILLMLGYFSWNIQIHYCADTIASVELAATQTQSCKKCVKKSPCCKTISYQNQTSQLLTNNSNVVVKKIQAQIVSIKHFVVKSFLNRSIEQPTLWVAYDEASSSTPIFLRNRQFRL
jgi:hypothetical protein